jgi:hypothetical protein
MYATFPAPLGSHYRLPLNSALSTILKRKHKRFDILLEQNQNVLIWSAYYRNKIGTFQSVPKLFYIEMERLGDFLMFKIKTRTKRS